MNVTLVIGERPERARALAQWLGMYGIDGMPCARDKELARRSLNAHNVSSVLLWVDRTRRSAEFFDTLRAMTPVPILVMSVAADVDNIVSYLDRGATDYIPGDMPIGAIAEKISGLTPPPPPRADGPLQVGDLEIDLDAREVTRAGERIALTALEFKLLSTLAENVGRACSRKMLLNRVWGEDFEDRPHYLRLYMGYLRQKLEKEPAHPRLLLTEWGYGYRLASVRKAGRRKALRPALRLARTG